MLVADVDTAVTRIADAMPAAREAEQKSQPFPVVPPVVHRVVEHQAVLGGDGVAIRHGDRTVTWRELNGRANAVARHLMASGFRRGDVAGVELPSGADLSIVLLAVLKAGGCYIWTPAAEIGAPACVLVHDPQSAERMSLLDVGHLLSGPFRSSPNLPVMVRGADAACILHENGAPVLVPHASLASLRQTAVPPAACCGGEAGAFDLWMLLMAGATVTMATPYVGAA
jgi:hypothetical protein